MNYKITNTKYKALRHFISIPFIYIVIVPTIFMDIFLELYHRICFPLYGIEYVKRRNYIKIDRHKLKFLNPVQKINCMYCGYVNGFMGYGTEIVARTEQYWCGIQHKKSKGFIAPKHHHEFIKYDDFSGFKDTYLK